MKIMVNIREKETAEQRKRLEKVREIPERTIKIFQYPRRTQYEMHIRKTPEEDASDSKDKSENI